MFANGVGCAYKQKGLLYSEQRTETERYFVKKLPLEGPQRSSTSLVVL
jgi:hypothetical protein